MAMSTERLLLPIADPTDHYKASAGAAAQGPRGRMLHKEEGLAGKAPPPRWPE